MFGPLGKARTASLLRTEMRNWELEMSPLFQRVIVAAPVYAMLHKNKYQIKDIFLMFLLIAHEYVWVY